MHEDKSNRGILRFLILNGIFLTTIGENVIKKKAIINHCRHTWRIMWQLSNFSKDFYVPSVGPDSYRDEPAQFPIGTDRHRCLSPTRLPPR
jgi:hypothetical protein